MSQPVIIWEKWDGDNKSTVLSVDIAYVASLCSFLKTKGVGHQCSVVAQDRWGLGRDKKRWDITTKTIVVSAILKPDDLEGWDMLFT
jgi:hypothetical protein